MLVDIYKSRKGRDFTFVFLPSGKEFNSLPQNIREDYGEFSFNKKVEINPGKLYIALKTEEALDSLNDKGYYIVVY